MCPVDMKIQKKRKFNYFMQIQNKMKQWDRKSFFVLFWREKISRKIGDR